MAKDINVKQAVKVKLDKKLKDWKDNSGGMLQTVKDKLHKKLGLIAGDKNVIKKRCGRPNTEVTLCYVSGCPVIEGNYCMAKAIQNRSIMLEMDAAGEAEKIKKNIQREIDKIAISGV